MNETLEQARERYQASLQEAGYPDDASKEEDPGFALIRNDTDIVPTATERRSGPRPKTGPFQSSRPSKQPYPGENFEEGDDEGEEQEPEHDELPDEPQEGDYVTPDHVNFYQDGKKAFTVPGGAEGDHVAALKAHMKKNNFYPDAWFQSDHGNHHRIDLSEGDDEPMQETLGPTNTMEADDDAVVDEILSPDLQLERKREDAKAQRLGSKDKFKVGDMVKAGPNGKPGKLEGINNNGFASIRWPDGSLLSGVEAHELHPHEDVSEADDCYSKAKGKFMDGMMEAATIDKDGDCSAGADKGKPPARKPEDILKEAQQKFKEGLEAGTSSTPTTYNGAKASFAEGLAKHCSKKK